MADRTIQRKRRLRMFRAEHAAVIILMTARALYRRAFISPVHVALIAWNSRMRPRQRELGLIVVENGWAPPKR